MYKNVLVIGADVFRALQIGHVKDSVFFGDGAGRYYYRQLLKTKGL